MKKVYNKLVRDNIPEIIIESDSKCNTRILENSEYLEILNAKLLEESNEWIESEDISEIADILEVLYAVIEAKGYSLDEVQKVREVKKEKRGGFDKRVFLVDVDSEK